MGRAFLYGSGGSSASALNFKIVGGADAPESPAENTIWVSTSETINGWIFSSEDPSSSSVDDIVAAVLPDDGFLWIKTSEKSDVSFNALMLNRLLVYPVLAYQWYDGGFVKRDAKIYIGGEWKDFWSGKLYDGGNLYSYITGGWTSDETSGAPQITYGNSSMTITASVSGENATVRTGNAINLSKWSTLEFEGTHENAQNYNLMGVINARSFSAERSINLNDSHSMDISDLTGDYYVFFQVRDAAIPTVLTKLYLT